MTNRAVITIHGIRTRGEWQKTFASVLASNGLVPYPLDYGRYSAFRIIMPWSRESQLNWFHNEYDFVKKKAGIGRPSIVAHSFGTYLTCHLMKQYEEVVFDKVILAGSIVPQDFDWGTILRRGQVLQVLNEIASCDRWPTVAGLFVGGAGNSGSHGFSPPLIRLEQKYSEIGHSGTFFGGRYENWCRFLSCPRLFSEKDLKSIQNLLEFAVDRAAAVLGVSAAEVRSNIFLPIDGPLRIPEGAHYNMSREIERTISIPVGRGSTGLAFKNRRPHTAFRSGASWGDAGLPQEELTKVDPRLQWIISFPLADPDNGRVFGVMNIDGLTSSAIMDSTPNNAVQLVIDELEHAHAHVMANKLCNLETGGI